MACFGALGNPEFIHPIRKSQKPIKSMHHPVRVSKMELNKVKDVACGYGYSVFAAKNKGKSPLKILISNLTHKLIPSIAHLYLKTRLRMTLVPESLLGLSQKR